MTAERWRQITDIFHAALAQEAAERDAFVASRCGADSALRREVEAMLAAHEKASGVGARPGGAAAPLEEVLSVSDVALAAGALIGPYEIVALLDVGGMGAVYRARDSKLHRDVAVKVLLPAVVGDADRVARFAREARVLASLNHPHIAQIYGLAESNGVRALVMELVEGPTLADRIARGPVAIGEALPIAGQIAEALEAAHEQHIVHRDLKPANIKLRPDGTVKVLDFGLAKALDAAADAGEQDATISAAPVSVPGLVLGTVYYMAPEQAKGLPVDRRADLWAFGCVLFEMLAGRRAFAGDTLPEVLAQVIDHEPDWSMLPAKTPPAIRTVLRRCLEKDPKRRFDSAAVARLEIEDVLKTAADARDPLAVEPRAPETPQARAWPWIAAAFVLGAAIVSVLFGTRGSADVPQNFRQVTSSLNVDSYPTWSPDGERLAYQSNDAGYYLSGNHDVWVAQIGSGEPVNLTKGSLANDQRPSWSPDGREIAFFSNREGHWGVYLVAALGGNPRKVLDLRGLIGQFWSAPQWSTDGTTLFVSAREEERNIVIVLPLKTLTPSRVVMPEHDSPMSWDLSVRPDGRRFAYLESGGGNPDLTRLWTTNSSGSGAIPLTDGRTNVWSPTWSSDGRNVFYVSNRGGTMDLWRQAVDDAGRPAGEAVAVTSGLGITSAAFSPDGTKLAVSRAGRISNVWRVPILRDRPATWADAMRVTSERAYIEFVDVSPDGNQLAVSSDRKGNQDLWLLPSAGGEMTQLTNDPTPEWCPRWSPDGDEIAFYAYRSGNRDIWVMPSRGGQPRQLTFRPEYDWFPRWSPDGREIVFQVQGPQQNNTWVVDAAGGEPRLLDPGGADFSPNGEWVIRGNPLRLVERASGKFRSFPGARGGNPRFSRDGQSIYTNVRDPGEPSHWRLSLTDGKTSQLTKLDGPRGRLGWVFSADDRYLYFTWYEDEGDIWVMDVGRTLSDDVP